MWSTSSVIPPGWWWKSTANRTAVAPADFTSASGQLLNFAPGETIKTFRIVVAGDARDELNEAFFINLSAASM